MFHLNNYRISQIHKILKKKNLNYILISDIKDAEYISGFRSSNVFLLISLRQKILFTDFRYQDSAADFCAKHSIWRFVKISENDFSFLHSYIKRGSRLGVQSNTITIDQFDKLKKECLYTKFVKIGKEISDILTVKTTREIRAMQCAASIGDKAFETLVKKIKVGMTEREIACMLENLCRKFGSEKPSFDTIVLFGSRAALPHGMPSNRKLKFRDWVLCDFGCIVNGFCSDMTRTLIIGKASNSQRKIYEIVLEAQQKAREKVRSGIKACEVDCCAREIIKKAGYDNAFGHGTGHGLGLRIHESPRIGKKNETILSANMVITIEPGIYIHRQGGVRIEDMVVVKENGSYTLTKSSHNLIEIPG